MTRRTVRARPGMTLLEVSVALAIAGAALASGAAVLGFLADQHARPSSEPVVAASAVRATLREWTSQARLATEGDAELRGRAGGATTTPRSQSRDDDASDELTFVTAAPTDVSARGTVVRLYVEPDATREPHGLVAELTPWRHTGAPVSRALAPDATTLHVRYLSSLFGQRSWLDSWVSTSVLPAALELRIGFDSSAAAGDVRAAHALLATPMLVPLAGRQ